MNRQQLELKIAQYQEEIRRINLDIAAARLELNRLTYLNKLSFQVRDHFYHQDQFDNEHPLSYAVKTLVRDGLINQIPHPNDGRLHFDSIYSLTPDGAAYLAENEKELA